ncbi:MAG: acireductone synthase [Sphingomonadales bacterium]
MSTKAILTDIEGTTSSIAFVTETLFPYARARLPAFVAEHHDELQGRIGPDPLAQLNAWMDADAKETVLKDVQGRIWAQGYAEGALQGHVYPDAAEALRRWDADGLALAVFSSGSVAAQKMIFGNSDQGDLSPLFSGWFDTTTGPKREAQSYVRIADSLGTAPADILFLSDIAAETDAAKAAGMKALLVDRETGQGDIASFAEIAL